MIILLMAVIGAGYFFILIFLLNRFLEEFLVFGRMDRLKASSYGFAYLFMIALPISYVLHGTSKGIGL